MATTIKQTEATPAAYPDPPDGLSDNAAALDPALIWQRIEAYVAHRWTPRGVVWTVEGPGEWTPPLTPAPITSAEVWLPGADWGAITLTPSPCGFDLPGDGPFRITAEVGGGDAPAAVAEAFRRLAEYLTGGRSLVNEPGSASYSTSIGGQLQYEIERNPAWVAKAMQWSGAADLLRPYRRA